MEDLLDGIEKNNIPAHAPLEQRWSASSSSYMSPAYYDGTTNGLYSWVGIINYLPSGNVLSTPEQEAVQRQEITNIFTGPYCKLLRHIGKAYDATSHWAKLEVPKSIWEIIDLQLHLSARFPTDKFNAYRSKLDPNNILASTFVNTLFGKP
jgi:L-galactono-1,4-lactone dehydrogenase